MVGRFGVSDVENSVSALRALVSEMDSRGKVCEDGRWMRPLA